MTIFRKKLVEEQPLTEAEQKEYVIRYLATLSQQEVTAMVSAANDVRKGEYSLQRACTNDDQYLENLDGRN